LRCTLPGSLILILTMMRGEQATEMGTLTPAELSQALQVATAAAERKVLRPH
jgi:hypothetical protein